MYENLKDLIEAIKHLDINKDSIMDFLSTGELKVEVWPEFYYDSELIEPGIDAFSVKFSCGDELVYRVSNIEEDNNIFIGMTYNGQVIESDLIELIRPLIHEAYTIALIKFVGARCLQLFVDVLASCISDYPKDNCFLRCKNLLDFIIGTPDVLMKYENDDGMQSLSIFFDRYNFNRIEIKKDSNCAHIISTIKPTNRKKLGPVSIEISEEIISTIIGKSNVMSLNEE